jgi:hypothetical protein
MHQRNQGGHHDGDAVARMLANNGRNLIAQTLAAARGHQDQRIASGTDVRNDALLRATKRFVAKNFAKDS